MDSRSEPGVVQAGTDVTNEAAPGDGSPNLREVGESGRKTVNKQSGRVLRGDRHMEWYRGT
ncbi:hypothetical protein FE783_31570 [Paenibacillus mesophilus]|nr:hypothetical protein FE783_31570 [Paenibacillus mesophilus]